MIVDGLVRQHKSTATSQIVSEMTIPMALDAMTLANVADRRRNQSIDMSLDQSHLQLCSSTHYPTR